MGTEYVVIDTHFKKYFDQYDGFCLGKPISSYSILLFFISSTDTLILGYIFSYSRNLMYRDIYLFIYLL